MAKVKGESESWFVQVVAYSVQFALKMIFVIPPFIFQTNISKRYIGKGVIEDFLWRGGKIKRIG